MAVAPSQPVQPIGSGNTSDAMPSVLDLFFGVGRVSAGDEHWGFSRPFANPGDQHDDRFDIARLHRCLTKQRVRGHDHGIPTAFAERNDACGPALAMPANKKKDPRYAEIYRDMPGYSGMRPRRLRPMIVGVPPRVGAAYAGIGRRNCGSRLLIHQMAFKPRFPGVLGSLK